MTADLLHLLRAHIVWLAFGECRSPGWDGKPPTAREAVDAIDAALAAQPALDLRDDLIETLRGQVRDLEALCEDRARRLDEAYAAQPAQEAAAVEISSVAQLKARELVAQGYKVCGYTLERPGHRSAVMFDAAVRWLTDEQRHLLMFVEGSSVTAPQSQAPTAAHWQPIETAPKDGTNVLLVNRKGNMAAGLWMDSLSGNGWYLRGGSLRPDTFFNDHHGPTHWMPLPAAPGAAPSPAPAPQAAGELPKPCLVFGDCKHGSWCTEVYCQEHCEFVKGLDALDALAELCGMATGGWDLPPSAVYRIGQIATWARAALAGQAQSEDWRKLRDEAQKALELAREVHALDAEISAPAAGDGAAQPCGHPASLLLRSAETGEPLYCEACDDKSGRRDAEQRETALQAANAELRAALSEAKHNAALLLLKRADSLFDMARQNFYSKETLLDWWLMEFTPDIHPKTNDLVRRFTIALLDKLAAAEKKYGYSDGWADPGWMEECRAKLLEHVAKGDPRDVAAYCAFLWHHGERTVATSPEVQP